LAALLRQPPSSTSNVSIIESQFSTFGNPKMWVRNSALWHHLMQRVCLLNADGGPDMEMLIIHIKPNIFKIQKVQTLDIA
jgi:hypothetical protein